MTVSNPVALVGCGLWGAKILRELCSLGGEVLVADPSPEQRAVAESLGASFVVATSDELPEVAGLIVATPASTHAAVVESLLPRKAPIFLEKPFTTDVASARKLAAAAAGRLFVMHVWRYHAGVRLLAEIARSRELGAVTMLRTTRVNGTSPRRDIDSVWTLAPHDLSIALEVLGYIPPPRGAVCERVGGVSRGMIALLGDSPSLVFDVSTRYGDKRREVRLHCERGVAVLPADDSPEVLVFHDETIVAETSILASVSTVSPTNNVAPQRRPIKCEPPLRTELRTFLEFLGGGPAPRSSAAEALVIVETLVALRRLAGVEP